MAGKDEEAAANKKQDDDKTEAKTGSAKPESEAKSSAAPVERLPASGSGASGSAHAHNGTPNGNGNGNGVGQGASLEPRDAVALLIADHRQVEQLFTRVDKASQPREKARLAREIGTALILHMLVEEEIFYPACAHLIEEGEVEEAQVEHDAAKPLIIDLMQGTPDDPFYDAKLKVLAEQIRHHVREEEKPKDGLFARVTAAGLETRQLGREIAQRKDALMRLAEAERLPKPVVRTIRSSGSVRVGARSMMEDEDMAQYYQQDYGQGRSMGRGRSRSGGGGYMGNERPRDEYGRFMSDDEDEDRGRGRSSGGGSRSRYAQDYDDDDRGHRMGGSRSGGRSRYADDDDDGRGHGRGGWFGDPEGHSRASRLGWEHSDHEGSGWYGDPEGHSRASRRGWEHSDHEGSGWYGDPEGHSEASRRGWEHRDDRGRDDRSRGGSRAQGGGRGRSGWYGDSEGHREASRRGWDDRR